ncbi:50S ribosomal protein L33 [Mycoplasmopsis cynos]|nr:50S ribosomal protein L33 [Mycoplasmopsis cynos]
MAREGYTLIRQSSCKMENYISKKNKKNHPEKVELSKYCSKCNAHTNHKEKIKTSIIEVFIF